MTDLIRKKYDIAYTHDRRCYTKGALPTLPGLVEDFFRLDRMNRDTRLDLICDLCHRIGELEKHVADDKVAADMVISYWRDKCRTAAWSR